MELKKSDFKNNKENKVIEYFLLKNGYVSNGLTRTQVI